MRSIKNKITKAEISTLPKALFPGRVFVIYTEAEADKAVEFLKTQSIVGVDTETRPSFKRGLKHKIALLQISTVDTCFLFRLNRIGLPLCIIDFLENEDIMKIGLSLHDDYQALAKREPFYAGSFLDLQKYVTAFGIEEMSLQKIFAIIFGQRISKSQQLTNWESDVLTDKQKLYAATDAWACLTIYNHLKTIYK